MSSAVLLATVCNVAACGSHKDTTERYAVGTYLYSGNTLFGPTGCTYEAPPGVLDVTKVIGPGTIIKTCGDKRSAIIAEYADHIALTFPKSVVIGSKVYFSFQLRNAKNQQLSPTLAGHVQLQPDCTALTNLKLDGADDTGRDSFLSANASAFGSCEVAISLELPTATGRGTLYDAQVVTVTH